MQYKIVNSSTSRDVEQQVNDLLTDGWELYGELKVTTYTSGDINFEFFEYNQAMVKRDPVEKFPKLKANFGKTQKAFEE